MTSREICFLCFVQHDARFWKCLWDFFGFKRVKTPKKFSRSYLQRRKMEKRKQKKALDYLGMSKLQEIFTTVAIVCPLYERLAVLQNVFAIILPCARKNKKEKKKEKTTVTHSPVARVSLLCFTTFWRHLWFYYWTDVRQHGIYLLKIWIWDLWSILC